MPFIGNQPAESYSAFQKQDFSTSATTSYTLDHPVANQNEIALFINFVRQEPTTAYTASGTSLTLTSATSASDDMYCVFLGKAVQTVNPPAGSVDSSKINYPLTTFSSTGIDDNGDQTVITIDNQERVGIRETSPISELHITDSSATAVVRLESSDTGDCRINFDDQSATDRGRIIYSHSDDSLRTEVAGSERMRINSNGNIQIATTTESGRLHIASSTTAGTDPLVVFSDASGTDCGSIDLNASGNTVAYTTSSDYRLKENVDYNFDATTRLKHLKPARFNFIADADKTVDGFIAHEVQDIVP